MVMRYRRKNSEVDALQHDGTDESALLLEHWVLSGKGDAVAYLKGSVDYAQNSAFVKVITTRSQNLVGPGAWIVRVAEGIFYPVSKEDFEILYEPLEPQEIEVPD